MKSILNSKTNSIKYWKSIISSFSTFSQKWESKRNSLKMRYKRLRCKSVGEEWAGLSRLMNLDSLKHKVPNTLMQTYMQQSNKSVKAEQHGSRASIISEEISSSIQWQFSKRRKMPIERSLYFLTAQILHCKVLERKRLTETLITIQ